MTPQSSYFIYFSLLMMIPTAVSFSYKENIHNCTVRYSEH